MNQKNERGEREDDDIEINEACKKGISYAENFAKIKGHETITSIKETLLSYNFDLYEATAIIDICPNSAEEAKALIPS